MFLRKQETGACPRESGKQENVIPAKLVPVKAGSRIYQDNTINREKRSEIYGALRRRVCLSESVISALWAER